MFTIRYVPEILHGLGDGTIAFGSEGSEFNTQEEAETFLAEFWLPETDSKRADYRIDETAAQ